MSKVERIALQHNYISSTHQSWRLSEFFTFTAANRRLDLQGGTVSVISRSTAHHSVSETIDLDRHSSYHSNIDDGFAFWGWYLEVYITYCHAEMTYYDITCMSFLIKKIIKLTRFNIIMIQISQYILIPFQIPCFWSWSWGILWIAKTFMCAPLHGESPLFILPVLSLTSTTSNSVISRSAQCNTVQEQSFYTFHDTSSYSPCNSETCTCLSLQLVCLLSLCKIEPGTISQEKYWFLNNKNNKEQIWRNQKT